MAKNVVKVALVHANFGLWSPKVLPAYQAWFEDGGIEQVRGRGSRRRFLRHLRDNLEPGERLTLVFPRGKRREHLSRA